MTQTSHPDASRLAYRIKTALTGESTGLETAKLAWQYAEGVQRANAALAEASILASAENHIELLSLETWYPKLLEAAASLDFEHAAAWRERCQAYSWRSPATIDQEAIARIQKSLEKRGDLKEWLYTEYRSAVRAKDDLKAFQIVSVINQRDSNDLNAKEEEQRLRSRLLDQAEKEVSDCLGELLPAENCQSIIDRFRAARLPLEECPSMALKDALSAIAAKQTEAANTQTQEVVKAAESLSESDDWMEAEALYLACDYMLATTGARGRIDSSLRTQFEEVGTKFSRLRASFESEIAIRAAIENLKNSVNGNSASGPGGKQRSKFADKLEKLRSLESQALKTSGRISDELKSEIKTALAFARKQKLPKIIIAAIAVVALIGLSTWLVQDQIEIFKIEVQQGDAKAAITQAQQSRDIAVAEKTLDVWASVLDTANDNLELLEKAAVLRDWIGDQKALVSHIENQIQQLEYLTRGSNPFENEREIQTLLQEIETSGKAIAATQAISLLERVEEIEETWSAALAEARRQNAARLATLQQELNLAAQNAANAKARDEFDRIYTAANQRIQSIGELVSMENDERKAKQIRELVGLVKQDLDGLDRKWAALSAEKLRLYRSDSLEAYLATLERIHSFDTLPPDEKASIEQSLRLKAAFAGLKSKLALPDDKEAWEAFSLDEAYRRSAPELSDEETEYIEDLLGNPVFESVYKSQVQYFEGSSEPQSEYSILLIEPIAKSDESPSDSDVSFSFRVRGFDEQGLPEQSHREVQFLSRSDGSFWGFYYRPSELSEESAFYKESIRLALKQALSGSSRFALIEELVEIDDQQNLAPAFKIYWQQRIIDFISLDPWKWGFALSPNLQDKAASLMALSGGKVIDRQWLSVIEQTVPSPDMAALSRNRPDPEILKQANAFASLYEQALAGEFSLAGYVGEDLHIELHPDVADDETLWTVNALTGQIELYSPDLTTIPYAPLVRYRLEEGDPNAVLRKAELLSGLDFSEPKFETLLPPIFKIALN